MVKKNEDTGKDALELAIEAAKKSLGNDILSGHIMDVKKFSSGCPTIDIALGGGYARGRIIEIFGPESSGKTTLTLHAVHEMQKLGEKVLFVDAEHALDPDYAKAIGVNVDDLLISQPGSGEEALQLIEQLVPSGGLGLVVVDSVASLVPRQELEKNIGDSTVGRQAMLMSQAMRKLAGMAAKTDTTIIFINQIRMKIGVMFGNPETRSGGNALKYYASQILDVRRTGGVKDGTELVANATRVKVVKNKVSPPFKEAEFQIRYGIGIDKATAYLQIGVENGYIVRPNRLMYELNGEKLKGETAVLNYLRKNEHLYEEINNYKPEPTAINSEMKEQEENNE